MLEASGVQKSFDDGFIFKPLSFKALQGTVNLVCGPNGSGKTTLLKCLSGHLTFEKGSIITSSHKDLKKISSISLCKDHGFFPQLSLIQNIIFFKKHYGSQKNITSLMKSLDLHPWINKAYQQCSTGIKRRLDIARSLLSEPEILLLDEPFSSMDEKFSKDLGDFIQEITIEKKLITILTSHQEVPNTIKLQQIIEVQSCSTH